jgi:hypothetical protein
MENGSGDHPDRKNRWDKKILVAEYANYPGNYYHLIGLKPDRLLANVRRANRMKDRLWPLVRRIVCGVFVLFARIILTTGVIAIVAPLAARQDLKPGPGEHPRSCFALYLNASTGSSFRCP